MIRRKIFVFFLFLGILILTTDAFALPVGQHFGFYDVMLPGTTNPWTHSLEDTDFLPHLQGDEPNLIIERALIVLSLNFKPTWYMGRYVFNASVVLDGNELGNIWYSSRFKHWVMNRIWMRSITDTGVLNSISIDRLADIQINPLTGKLKYVNNSVLLGHGVVGPEPISMALIGAGLVGLPIAVRLRRFLRKQKGG